MQLKNLFIIRHAKAEEHSFAKQDFDRNLIEKGEERAHRIAQELRYLIKIDEQTLFISSTANRAWQTAQIFADVLGYRRDLIQLEDSIYESHHFNILEVINQVPATIHTVLLFGHNPGLSNAVDYITDNPVMLKTSNVAQITLPGGFDFNNLSVNTGTLTRILD
ncbi:SixA phosphatase family protein [Sphingobacterium spiritivorum]